MCTRACAREPGPCGSAGPPSEALLALPPLAGAAPPVCRLFTAGFRNGAEPGRPRPRPAPGGRGSSGLPGAQGQRQESSEESWLSLGRVGAESSVKLRWWPRAAQNWTSWRSLRERSPAARGPAPRGRSCALVLPAGLFGQPGEGSPRVACGGTAGSERGALWRRTVCCVSSEPPGPCGAGAGAGAGAGFRSRMRRSHTPRQIRHQEWPTCCPPPQDCTPVPFPVDSSPAKLAVTSAGAASVPEPLPLPSRVPASFQGLFRAGTPSRPHASGAQAHRRCLCVTWGVPACPRANQPRVTLLPPPDLHGETDRLILGSWLEWGPCWFSSAVCSRGAGLHVSLGPPSGRTWHVQMCRRWAHSSAGGWAAGPRSLACGTWPWAPG